MGKVNYLLLDMSVLPEVYVKVIKAKGYLQSGEAANASQAIKMAGISCSAYYKYKDKIFEYSEQGDDATTINAKLQDNAGVLSSVMNELYIWQGQTFWWLIRVSTIRRNSYADTTTC